MLHLQHPLSNTSPTHPRVTPECTPPSTLYATYMKPIPSHPDRREPGVIPTPPHIPEGGEPPPYSIIIQCLLPKLSSS